MRHSEQLEYGRTIKRAVSEADAEPEPIPVRVAVLLVFLLALGLGAVIWLLAETL